MAKFVYSMENILQMKMKLEEQAKNEYSRRISELRTEEEKKVLLEQERERYKDQLRELIEHIVKVPEVKKAENAVEVKKMQIKQQEVVIKGKQLEVDKAQKELTYAMQERKTYEKLKEKAFDEFKAEILREEQKEVDELVSYRFGSAKDTEGDNG